MGSKRFVGVRLQCAISTSCPRCTSKVLEEWQKCCGWRRLFQHDYTWKFSFKDGGRVKGSVPVKRYISDWLYNIAVFSCNFIWQRRWVMFCSGWSLSLGPWKWERLACGVECVFAASLLGHEVVWCVFKGDEASEAEWEQERTESYRSYSVGAMPDCMGTLLVGRTEVSQYELRCSTNTRLLGTKCLFDREMLIKAWVVFFLVIALAAFNLLSSRHMLFTSYSLIWLSQRYINSDM